MSIRTFIGQGVVGSSLYQRGFVLSPNSDGVQADSNGDDSPNELPVIAIPDEEPFFKIDPEGYVKQSDVDGLMVTANIPDSVTAFALLQIVDKANQFIQEGDYILAGRVKSGTGTGFNGENQEIIKVTSISSYDTSTGMYTIAHSKRGCFGTTAKTHILGDKVGRYYRGIHVDFFQMVKANNSQLRIAKLIDIDGNDLVADSGASYILLQSGMNIMGKFKEFKRYSTWNSGFSSAIIYK